MKTKRLQQLLLLTPCIFIWASCSDNENLPDSPGNDDQTTDAYIAPSVQKGSIAIEVLHPHTDPFLGAGYDIMGNYLSNFSVKLPVLDLSKIEDNRITIFSGASGEADSFSGRGMKEFLRSMTEFKEFVVPTENKDDLLFSGTITELKGFEEPYDYSSQYTFTFESSGSQILTQRLNTLNPKWDSWLADEFREALEFSSPQEIIEEYGTHVLVQTDLGYTVKTLYRSVVADEESELLRTAIAGMGARKNTIYKVPYISITYPEETVKKNYGGAIAVSFQGGDYNKLPYIQLTPDGIIGDPINIVPWASSCNKDTYALTTLSGKHLIPIYDIITDPTKKQEIKETVTAYITAHQPTVQQTAPIFQATDGSSYRYYTSYEKLTTQTLPCQGVIASVFVHQEAGTVPLYLSSGKEGGRLSVSSAETGATIIGYVYEEQNNGNECKCLYEVSDGKSFAYTTELKEVYGEKGTWKLTGKSFYTKKV